MCAYVYACVCVSCLFWNKAKTTALVFIDDRYFPKLIFEWTETPQVGTGSWWCQKPYKKWLFPRLTDGWQVLSTASSPSCPHCLWMCCSSAPAVLAHCAYITCLIPVLCAVGKRGPAQWLPSLFTEYPCAGTAKFHQVSTVMPCGLLFHSTLLPHKWAAAFRQEVWCKPNSPSFQPHPSLCLPVNPIWCEHHWLPYLLSPAAKSKPVSNLGEQHLFKNAKYNLGVECGHISITSSI